MIVYRCVGGQRRAVREPVDSLDGLKWTDAKYAYVGVVLWDHMADVDRRGTAVPATVIAIHPFCGMTSAGAELAAGTGAI